MLSPGETRYKVLANIFSKICIISNFFFWSAMLVGILFQILLRFLLEIVTLFLIAYTTREYTEAGLDFALWWWSGGNPANLKAFLHEHNLIPACLSFLDHLLGARVAGVLEQQILWFNISENCHQVLRSDRIDPSRRAASKFLWDHFDSPIHSLDTSCAAHFKSPRLSQKMLPFGEFLFYAVLSMWCACVALILRTTVRVHRRRLRKYLNRGHLISFRQPTILRKGVLYSLIDKISVLLSKSTSIHL